MKQTKPGTEATSVLKTIRISYVGFILFLVLSNAQSFGQKVKGNSPGIASVPTDATVLPLDPAVKIGVLPNGLTYYIRRNSEPQNRAELYLVNKIGSLQEDDDQQGLAHFTEHMAFNGTRDFPKNELINYLQKAGVRFGADLNAYTSFDETVYQLPLPTDSMDVFLKGFDILLNWAGFVTCEGEEIDKERGIILEEERQSGKNAEDRMNKQIYPVLMAGSQYAQRLPIGKTEILKSFEHKTIRRFYHDWYRPNLQAIIAVGDFDVLEVEKLIRLKFAVLKNPEKTRTRKEYSIPKNKKPLVKIVTDPEFGYTSATIFYKHPERVIRTKEDYKAALVASMVNMMLNERIQEVMQKGNARFMAAEGSYGPFMADRASFTVNVFAKEAGELKEAVQAVMAEVFRMKKFGFTTTELIRSKQNLLTGIKSHYEEKDKTPSSSYVQEYQRHFLKGEATPGIAYEYKLYQEILSAVTAAEINLMAANLITTEDRTLILQANEKDKSKLPDEATFLSWSDGTGRDVTDYVDQTSGDSLLSKLPAAGTIVAERKLDSINATEFKLSNGATVVLRSTEFKNDQILFSATSPGGQSLASDRDFRSAQLASSLINASGLAAFDNTTLGKKLSGKNVSVNSFINNYEEGIAGSTVPKDLEPALQLMHLYFVAPRKDTAVFRTMVEDIGISMKNRYISPVTSFEDTINAVMTSRHPRAKIMSIKEIEAIDQNEAIAFYKTRFADAGDFTFFFVGNFDRDKIKPLICQYIASLPSLSTPENFRDLGMKPLLGNITRAIHRGLEDKAMVALIYHGNYEYNPLNNLKIDALKSILQIRLTERLREKESGVYSPKVNSSYNKIPGQQYTIQVNFSCATANVERLIDAVKEELLALKTKGISDEDLRKFVAEEKRQLELQVRDNSFWMYHLESIYKKEHPINFLQTYPTMLDSLTTGQLKEAINVFLNDQNFIRVILLPEKS